MVFKCFANIRITCQIAFLCVHAPRGHIYLRFLPPPPPPPLSDENPVMVHFFAYAEIIFAHILAFPACAIEMQHINENSPAVSLLLGGQLIRRLYSSSAQWPLATYLDLVTVVRACWVTWTRWWGSQKFVWEYKVN